MTPPVSHRRRTLLLAAAVTAVTIAVFLPSLRGEFLNYDDDANFTGNPRYRGLGPEQLKWMFTDFFGHYIPLTWVTFGLDYVVWGMNPLGYHLSNLLFHGANAALVFVLLLGLLRRTRPRDDEPALQLLAAAGALLFSIHPLRVESVAWITERRDLTSGLCFLLTLLAYLRATHEPPGTRPHRKWLALSLAAFAASLLCKAMGMTLPLVLLLLDLWPLKRFGPGRTRAVLLEKVPYLALMAGGILLTRVAQGHADAIYSAEQYPLAQSLAQPGFRVAFYIVKTLIPVGLSPLYFYRPELGWPQVAGWIAVAGGTGIVLLFRRQAPAAAAAWMAYGLLIAPVCGLVQVGPHYAADRNTYLACLPFAALAAAALAGIPRRTAATVAVGLLVVLATLTVRQERIWINSVALWDAALRHDPDVYYSWHNRGRAKAERHDWEGAAADLTRAIELRSGFPDPWRERARVFARQNRHDLAVEDLKVALRLEPGRADCALELGISEARLGRQDEALGHFTRAIELRPDFPEARVQRAQLRALHGDAKGALADLDVVLQANPSADLYLRRAVYRVLAGDLDGAIADCTEAIRQKPDSAEAYARRGAARLESKDAAGAAQDFTKALDLAPANWPARRQVEASLRSLRNP